MGELTLRKRAALEVFRLMKNSIKAEHPLRELFWECTLRCNLACRHCGSDCKNLSTVQDMPKEDFLRVLDEVAAECDPHSVFIILTGGEPLLRPDLEECGRAIFDRGFPWGMVTNGYALTPERFVRLMQAGLGSITVSLDGREEDHDWMRGREQSFERASAAIRMIAASDVTYDVVTCVNRRNYADLPAIRDLLISWGVKAWRLFTVFPVGRAAEDPDLQLSREEFRGVMDFIRQTRREGRIQASYGCEGFLGRYEADVRDSFFFCRAGVATASVLADGSISSCPSLRADYHQGNIYRDKFMDVWNNRFQPFRDRSWMRRDECAGCRWWRYCEGSGMHLRDADGRLLFCHLHRLQGD